MARCTNKLKKNPKFRAPTAIPTVTRLWRDLTCKEIGTGDGSGITFDGTTPHQFTSQDPCENSMSLYLKSFQGHVSLQMTTRVLWASTSAESLASSSAAVKLQYDVLVEEAWRVGEAIEDCGRVVVCAGSCRNPQVNNRVTHWYLKATTRTNTRIARVIGAVSAQNCCCVHVVLLMSFRFIPE